MSRHAWRLRTRFSPHSFSHILSTWPRDVNPLLAVFSESPLSRNPWERGLSKSSAEGAGRRSFSGLSPCRPLVKDGLHGMDHRDLSSTCLGVRLRVLGFKFGGSVATERGPEDGGVVTLDTRSVEWVSMGCYKLY